MEKTKLWDVRRMSDCILLETKSLDFGFGHDHFIYRATEKRAKEIFNTRAPDYRKVNANWGYNHGIEIPLDTTIEEAKCLRATVLKDVEKERKRFQKVSNALLGIDRAKETLDEVVKTLTESEY